MNNHTRPAPMQALITGIAVVIFCYGTVTFSGFDLLGRWIPFSVSSHLLLQFEHHFWIFAAGFIAIGYVSRGHLWSFGINSNNLKDSMKWLAVLYGFVSIGTAGSLIAGSLPLPFTVSMQKENVSDIVMTMLIYWMSSPVANQILFFGFGQTMLQKSIGYDVRIGPIPAIVVISAVSFSFFACDSSLEPVSMSYAVRLALGFYSGIVYWKTGSLITPMLGHAFAIGFPVFVHYLFMYG